MWNFMKTSSKYVLAVFAMFYALNSLGQKPIKDTTFLYRETSNNIYHAIFIDTSKTSQFYDVISDFKFGEFDQASYDYSLDFLKSKNIKLTKTSIDDLPKKWIILKYYHGEYFTYKPSDSYTHFKIEITDSTFTEYTGEGPLANKVLSYSKVNDKTFSFSLTGVDNPNRDLTVHIINSQKGIAVFEERLKNKKSSYYLMIDAAKIRQLPIIVNYCETDKQVEFDFEEPDYQKLIGMK